jgi:polar amino acid transport system substrate-binding protein
MRAKLAILAVLVGAALPAAARADLLQDIRSRGTLKVGMAEYFPWMVMGRVGKPVGLEVEIAERLAADLGVELQVVTIPFEQLVDRLAAREVDLVASNLSITPERALKVAFTQPYNVSEIRPVVRLDKFPDEVDAAEALNADAVTIGVTAGTTSADTAAQQFPLAQITEFATHEEAARALMGGRTMAFVGSTPFPELLAAAAPEQLAIGGEEPLRTTVEAFAVPQGEPILLTFLDNWIDAVSAEGFIASRRLEWFDAEPPEEPAAPARPVPQ